MRTIPALRAALAALTLALLPAFAAAQNPTADAAATLWRLLDYVAVDYREAVDESGAIINDAEYAEMQEFSRTVRARLDALPELPERAILAAQSDALIAAVEQRAAPAAVAEQARALAAALILAYPVVQAPMQLPDLARGGALYAQMCASCHGATGAGDGPLAAGMEPPPIDFTDAARAAERSPFALFQVIAQGLEGTAMAGYGHLPAADRWALAFYSGTLAATPALRKQGAALWQQGVGREAIDGLGALSGASAAALAPELGAARAAALLAYLRSAPAEVLPDADDGLQLARQRLARANAAYAQGAVADAADLALSAYLDGFEPVEPLLATRDAALLREVEGAMIELRARIGAGAPAAAVAEQAATVAQLFDRAEAAIGDAEAHALSAFLGAFTILLREGLEALLIVVAILAFLRKAGRPEGLRYVHLGWIGALLAGVATWGVATWLIGISGASRELTEGFAALFAALVLLGVGIWMHGKGQAGAWQHYVREKLSQALSRRSIGFLALLSFVVVYREVFETILFYAALWSRGAHDAILAGGASAVAVLVVIAWAMLRWSRRLPVAQFFSISAVLMAVLAVVLAGKGVAALQEGGVLAIDTLAAPRIDWLGVYPTWQGLSAQAAVLAALVAGFAWNRRVARALPARTGA